MVTPVLNSHGDTKQKLIDQCIENYDAISDAIHTLAKNAPNGRNYRDSVHFEQAKKEHWMLVTQLKLMLADIDEKMIIISNL